MGDLSDPDNTFWQLLHAVAGIVALVTGHTARRGGQRRPRGGGLRRLDPGGGAAEQAAPLLAAVAEHRRGRLLEPRLPPLGLGCRSRTPWRIRALHRAVPSRVAGGGARVLAAPVEPLVLVAAGLGRRPRPSVARLRRHRHSTRWRSCPPGRRWSATDCRRGGRIGVFTRTAGSWQPSGFVFGGLLRGSATEVLRLAVDGSTTDGARLGQPGRAPSRWSRSGARTVRHGLHRRPLALTSGTSVLSTAVSTERCRSPCSPGRRGRRAAVEIAARGLVDPAAGAPVTDDCPCDARRPRDHRQRRPLDAFTVDGGSLGVFALSPSGATVGRGAVEPRSPSPTARRVSRRRRGTWRSFRSRWTGPVSYLVRQLELRPLRGRRGRRRGAPRARPRQPAPAIRRRADPEPPPSLAPLLRRAGAAPDRGRVAHRLLGRRLLLRPHDRAHPHRVLRPDPHRRRRSLAAPPPRVAGRPAAAPRACRPARSLLARPSAQSAGSSSTPGRRLSPSTP